MRSLLPFFRPGRSAGNRKDKPLQATLIAIAKNEGPYIYDWIIHHLSVGFSKIIVFDNESTDDTSQVLQRIALACPNVSSRVWRSFSLHESPQMGAYNDALRRVSTEWVMFMDIDEFLVPYRDYSISAYLARAPLDVSSIHINWRGFGSSGHAQPNYGSVVEAFTRCAPASWGNNTHFKSIARTALVEKVYIHNVDMREGRRVLSDFGAFETLHNGMSNRIVHDGIQINHYQSKTYPEFKARMEKGDANYHPNHEHRRRDFSKERFVHLDVNEEEDVSIAVFKARSSLFSDVIKRRMASLDPSSGSD